MNVPTTFDLKHRSRALTDGAQRAAARAYLHGIGYSAEDLAKPIVGVAHSWIETMPCNFNNRVLAAKVKDGIRAVRCRDRLRPRPRAACRAARSLAAPLLRR